MKKIALITSGGDAPGMNACVRAIVKTCLFYKIIPFGIYDGFQGMIEKRGVILGYEDIDNMQSNNIAKICFFIIINLIDKI